jgi:2-polyprenyl-3-methyl-5-hydroxy-6-metoxy-1,4-benzoquinol methylase
MNEDVCIVCSSNSISFFKLAKINLKKCNSCGLISLYVIPTKNQLDLYYENEYYITDNFPEISERRRFYKYPEQIKLIANIKRHISPKASLLDIGCDKGFFIDEARRYGYDVQGVEPSKIAREYCKKIGLDIYKDIKEINNKYDIITLWHVLEHTINPKEFIKYYKKFTKR